MTPEIHDKQKGFTLLEIVVSLIVASILGSMLLVYVGTAYNRSVEPVMTSKRVLQMQQVMETINAIYAGMLNRSNLLDSFTASIATVSLPPGLTCDTSKRFTFPASGDEPAGSDPSGNVLKVVLRDTTVQPNLELIALFYSTR
jgi:prepilin-type N-terminal cleavage/methylation domain-containing protein